MGARVYIFPCCAWLVVLFLARAATALSLGSRNFTGILVFRFIFYSYHVFVNSCTKLRKFIILIFFIHLHTCLFSCSNVVFFSDAFEYYFFVFAHKMVDSNTKVSGWNIKPCNTHYQCLWACTFLSVHADWSIKIQHVTKIAYWSLIILAIIYKILFYFMYQ